MTRTQQHGIRLDILEMSVLFGLYAVDIAVCDYYIRHFAVESYLSAERDYLPADIAHDLGKAIGAYMRLCRPAYLLRCAVVCKLVYHKTAQRVFYARCQLAVRKRARAALAELHIGLRIQPALVPKDLNILLPVLNMRSAL